MTIYLPILASLYNISLENSSPPCKSDIYCYGDLLHYVQMTDVFKDQKTFVDMTLKYPPKNIQQSFHALLQRTEGNPTVEQLRHFVNRNFDGRSIEFDTWTPPDWVEQPAFITDIADPDLRTLAARLHQNWKGLGKKVKNDVRENKDLHSLLYVPNGMIVPGSRYREYYYWDSYWIIQGLLVSEMTATVRGMLQNFRFLLESMNHIPNGGRLYYEQRSQPPLFINMVNDYLEFTQDYSILNETLDAMEEEFSFWLHSRTIQVNFSGNYYSLARYKVNSTLPRPEFYKLDWSLAEGLEVEEQTRMWSEIHSISESGYDFSSRFVVGDNGSNSGSWQTIKPSVIIPVDLNAILCSNARILSNFFGLTMNESKREKYAKIADDWLVAVSTVLYDKDVGIWLDYDIQNNIRRNFFYAQNVFPLWTGCYDKNEQPISKVVQYLSRKDIVFSPGGVPVSDKETGARWDFPNVQPPTVFIIVMGLGRTRNEEALSLAFKLANIWMRSIYRSYVKYNALFERYNAMHPGEPGTGEEAELQTGFGWTTGITIALLEKYGERYNVSFFKSTSCRFFRSALCIFLNGALSGASLATNNF